jgi:hypothetical protein
MVRLVRSGLVLDQVRRGLVTGGHAKVLVDDASVVVTPEAARRQIDEAPTTGAERTAMSGPTPAPGGAEPSPALTPPVRLVRRFYGAKSLDPQRVSRDADQIANEVIKHLVALVDAGVEIKLEISADVPSGVPEDIVRTVTETRRR